MAACTDCLTNLPSHRLGISILVIKMTLKVFEDGQHVNLSNKLFVTKKLNACFLYKKFSLTTETLSHGVFLGSFLCVFVSPWFKPFLVSACPS